eukprot:CAMPEP_0203891068 /NCGR_PEP_ID=MMETSP0359-20131031/34405_1 /ASSEMBLY_ACC=CAM_ASM_000338 /TAXON_ID=268821 /ORGANISM="Scrippsiella Hangoei, Strain SHTV-5" /LENGTH=367 /DNA_ID=CAMNT_0050812793 /DNA_START=69 /DNA_END=1170 /DNA_ORIENTATION=+
MVQWWSHAWQRFCSEGGKETATLSNIAAVQIFLQGLDGAFKSSGSQGVAVELASAYAAMVTGSNGGGVAEGMEMLQQLCTVANAMVAHGYFITPVAQLPSPPRPAEAAAAVQAAVAEADAIVLALSGQPVARGFAHYGGDSFEELVSKVTKALNNSERVRKAWANFCEVMCQSQAPRKKDAKFLIAFLSTHAASLNAPPTPFDAVIAIVRQMQNFEWSEKAWRDFNAGRAELVLNPARHEPESLVRFLVLLTHSTPPPNDPNATALMAQAAHALAGVNASLGTSPGSIATIPAPPPLAVATTVKVASPVVVPPPQAAMAAAVEGRFGCHLRRPLRRGDLWRWIDEHRVGAWVGLALRFLYRSLWMWP